MTDFEQTTEETEDSVQYLKTLKYKRGRQKAMLTGISKFLDSYDPQTKSSADLTFRKKKLEECWDTFNTIQAEIQTISDNEDDDVVDEEYDIFMNKYLELGVKFEALLTKPVKDHLNTTVAEITDNIKLPEMPLPSFSGKYEEWTDFHDAFESLIHNSRKLSNIQKFYYLRSCLTDEAFRIIKEIKVSAANYESAWTTLVRRFKNKKLIIKAHVENIMNFEQLEKPSASKLKNLYDTINNHLIALKNLNEPTDQWSTLLVFVITGKLDAETRIRWEAYQAKQELIDQDDQKSQAEYRQPYSFDMLMKFIFEQSLIQEVREEHGSQPKKNSLLKVNKNYSRLAQPSNKTICHTTSMPVRHCTICSEEHNTFNCQLAVNQRLEKVRERRLCLNCLKPGHKTIQCKSPHNCKRCNKRHHTMLHLDSKQSPQEVSKSDQTNQSGIQNTIIAGCSNCNQEVILATAVILIRDSQGIFYPCRALLDSGSQSNFISQSLSSALGLQRTKTSNSVTGIGSTWLPANWSVHTTIKSRYGNVEESLDLITLSKITNDLPSTSINTSLNIPNHVKLADEDFYHSRGIDVLLGASIFFNSLRIGQIKLGDDQPTLQNTSFGWIVGGKLQTNHHNKKHTTLIALNKDTSELESLMSSFWKVEEISNKQAKSHEEEACEQHYISNVKRDENGKFVVKLPFNIDPLVSLGHSKDQAIKRLQYLEGRFAKDPELKRSYSEFLNEYLENDEMELVIEEKEPECAYYLPHHPIIKSCSSTTKLRVVFDASAKTTNNNSLNNILMVGPTLQRDLFSILLSFRTPTYVFTSDIKQMYRKILVDETQRDFQRILWRENPSDPIKTFRLTTVTYGTASAPFLAIRTLLQLAIEGKKIFPKASAILQRDFYVDDVLTGGDSLEEVINLQSELINLLKSGGFELRKWCANHPALLENIPNSHIEEGFVIEETGNKTIKTLGIYWQPISDTFRFNVNLSDLPEIITKRVILSDISRIFDPIGLLSPIVITAKLFMQELWLMKNLDWDQPISETSLTKWKCYRDSLPVLNSLSINRRVLCGNSNQTYELHGFSDASERAYGACLYVRTIHKDRTINVNFLCAKSRVAPLKQISLPRLELCGAVLLAQLLHKTLEALKNINFKYITLWTDSTIVLHWLNSPPNTWQIFVGNRVSQIQDLTQNYVWKHIRSQDNPADIITRSVSPKSLITCQLWWHGPHWLSGVEENWPESIQTTSIDPNVEERRMKITTHSLISTSSELIHKFSSWNKLLRITALCQRFIKHCRSPAEKSTGYLNADDLQRAEMVWIREVQKEFIDDINNLKKGKEASNKIKSFAPFIDEDGILRVGGRLKNALISLDHKHPILLPADHHITRLIVQQIHIDTLHSGPQALLSTIRLKYWPLNGKILTRSIVRHCFKCNRVTPKPAKHLMGDLPSYRVQPSRPFENCGIDFCGPFLYRRVLQRKSQPIKSYVALFICMSTKAIHLELVTDLTTTKFIEALERMIARRGLMKNIYSDNATNFVGAKNELCDLQLLFNSESNQHQLHSFCASKSINWHFIPPRSPHFGGLWEAGVKIVKGHLKRVLGNNILSYDELETLFIKIEACVNSRPLSALSNNPNDLSPLTPSHFLIGEPSSSFPVPDFIQTNINRLNHWQRVQQLYQTFWRRWSHEYLSLLQPRTKWKSDFPPIQLGTLVLLKDDFRPPLQWTLGRIIELHRGEDGRARVATVRTSKGLFKRALVKLCPLPGA